LTWGLSRAGPRSAAAEGGGDELLGLLDGSGFSCWIFSGGGTDFMRAWTADDYGLPPHRVIGSVGETEFRAGDDGPAADWAVVHANARVSAKGAL
jgi:hypothetical protein